VLCRVLWITQQKELFDEFDKQCQKLADAVIPAIAQMELNGMPVDVAAHRAQIAQWKRISPTLRRLFTPLRQYDLRRSSDLQRHLQEVWTAMPLTPWLGHRAAS
jgi:hypothetical protein